MSVTASRAVLRPFSGWSRSGLWALFLAIMVGGAACVEKPKFGDDAGVDAGKVTTDGGRDAGPKDGGVDAGSDAGEPDGGVDAGDGGLPDGGDGGLPDGGDGGLPDGGDAGLEPMDGGDGGPPDGGTDGGPDGGFCPPYGDTTPSGSFGNFAKLGETCDPRLAHGFCEGDLDCVPIPPGQFGICSVRSCSVGPLCTTDERSFCVAATPTMCVLRCDDMNPCPRNSVCVDGLACLPDCRVEPATYCPLEFGGDKTCDSETGTCRRKACTQNSDCSGIGVCNTSLQACVTDCRTDPSFCCTMGQVCSEATGRCNPGPPFSGGVDISLQGVPALDGGPDAGFEVVDAGDDAGVMEEPDAGIDAGLCEPYIGPSLPDAGSVANAPIGYTCLNGTLNASTQSNCASGLRCFLIDGNASECVLLGCTNNNQCGTNGLCVPNIPGIGSACVTSCDGSKPCPAGSGTTCQATESGATICLPDCRNQWPNYCSLIKGFGDIHATCNATTGQCETVSCASASCPAGSICDPATKQCTPDCRQQNAQFCCSGLGAGRLCTSSGLCVEPPRPDGGTGTSGN